MASVTVTSCWKSLLLVALMGVPGLGAKVQISWTGRVTAGSPTTFTCSSNCFPNCIYTWSFKASTVNGTTLTWTPDGLDDTVKLHCTVFNPQTGVYTSTDAIVEITNTKRSKVYTESNYRAKVWVKRLCSKNKGNLEALKLAL